VYWIHLAQERDQWLALVNTVMNFRFNEILLNSLVDELLVDPQGGLSSMEFNIINTYKFCPYLQQNTSPLRSRQCQPLNDLRKRSRLSLTQKRQIIALYGSNYNLVLPIFCFLKCALHSTVCVASYNKVAD
jgi:hypothetical protein